MASAQDFKRIDTDSEIQEKFNTASETESKTKESEFTSPVVTPWKYGKCETGKVVARPSVKRGAVSSPEVSPSMTSSQPSVKKLLTAAKMSPTKSLWKLNFWNPFRVTKVEEMVEDVEQVQEEDSTKVDASKGEKDADVLTAKDLNKMVEVDEHAQKECIDETDMSSEEQDTAMLTILLSRLHPEIISKVIENVQKCRGIEFWKPLNSKNDKSKKVPDVNCSESTCSESTCFRNVENRSVPPKNPLKENVVPEVKSNAAESAKSEKWICICGFDNFMVRKVCFQCSANKGSVLTKANGVVSRVVTRESYFYAFIESEEGVFCFFPKKNVVTQKLKEGDRVVFKKVEGMKGGKRSRAYEVEVISAAKSLSGTVTKFKQAQTHAWGIIKSERNFYFFTMHRDQELNVGGTVKFCVLSTADNRKNSKGPRYPKVIIKEVEAL